MGEIFCARHVVPPACRPHTWSYLGVKKGQLENRKIDLGKQFLPESKEGKLKRPKEACSNDTLLHLETKSVAVEACFVLSIRVSNRLKTETEKPVF